MRHAREQFSNSEGKNEKICLDKQTLSNSELKDDLKLTRENNSLNISGINNNKKIIHLQSKIADDNNTAF